MKVTVVGSGSWGTAVANIFADTGADTLIWGRDPGVVEAISSRHENPKYLPGCPLNPRVTATNDLALALKFSNWIVCAIPTQKIRLVFAPFADQLAGKTLINTSKGLEIGTHMRVSQVFESLCPTAKYVILSGPSFAQEVVVRQPTAITLAGADKKQVSEIQKKMVTPYFRSYTTRDVVGVELAGALKNVVALATGIVRGSKMGHNAQAAVITRGLAEIARAGRQLGADSATFLGLAGMGDLVLTCTGPLSRNLRAGILIGEGKPLDSIMKTLGGVAEGVYTAQSANEMAMALGIDMPILSEIHSILYEGKTPERAVASLMSRGLKEETA